MLYLKERGYCSLGCPKNSASHDVQIVLNTQLGFSNIPQVYTSKNEDIPGAHEAFFDAYMTGFAFCFFLCTLAPSHIKACKNKMILSYIKTPLTIPSPTHSV